MRNKIIWIFFCIPALSFSAVAAEKTDGDKNTIRWPLNNVKIIASEDYAWSEKFFVFAGNRLYSYSVNEEKTALRGFHDMAIKPEFARFFPMYDVDVVVVWNNTLGKLEILIFDKGGRFLQSEQVKLDDEVDDLQVRFGQGRRPALLLVKNRKDEYKVSLWFDDREQIIFIQSSPILASALDWSKLSALVVTREGSRPMVKVWKKGLVSSYELPFFPVFSKFADLDDRVYLLAIDPRSTLWSISVEDGRVNAVKALYLKDLAYIKQIRTVLSGEKASLVMNSSLNKKVYVSGAFNFTNNNNPAGILAYPMLDSDTVFPGMVSNKLRWLETNSSGHTYLVDPEAKTLPFMDLTWKIETRGGFPEAFFSWGSRPANRQFEYRYMLDDKPDSQPLPEYRVRENRLNVKLSAEGDYYLHIQARDPLDGTESVVYHFPVFWKYRPPIPDIYLLNEITPYVVTGKSLVFVISNLQPLEYFAEVNTIPVYDPVRPINVGSGEVQVNQEFKPGRYYLHLRSKDPKTNSYGPTLHYLFFYQTYVAEFSIGGSEYNKDIGKLNSLINQYQNAQSIQEKDRILQELEMFRKSLEEEIAK